MHCCCAEASETATTSKAMAVAHDYDVIVLNAHACACDVLAVAAGDDFYLASDATAVHCTAKAHPQQTMPLHQPLLSL